MPQDQAAPREVTPDVTPHAPDTLSVLGNTLIDGEPMLADAVARLRQQVQTAIEQGKASFRIDLREVAGVSLPVDSVREDIHVAASNLVGIHQGSSRILQLLMGMTNDLLGALTSFTRGRYRVSENPQFGILFEKIGQSAQEPEGN